MNSKQLKRQLYLSILLALLTIGSLAVATFSWLAVNREVKSDGMQIQAETTANLVISSNQSNWADTTTVSAVARTLLPAMHSASSASGLQRVADSVIISQSTGLPANVADLAYTDVAKVADSPYYIDYTVYIAAIGKALTANLTAAITQPTGDDIPDYHQAASIDFYVGGEYADTLNLAGLDLSNDTTYSGTAKETTVNLASAIPCKDTDGEYITVLMRCYFDGALHNDTDTTFVTTNNLQTSGFELGVRFSAEEPTTP